MNNNTSVSISIIIPYYNVIPEYFDKCFSSIVDQSFVDFEVIVVDDGSKKEIGLYLQDKIKEDKRFRLIRQDNYGVSAARNRGMKEASGVTFCFIDADDYIAPWMLEDLWKEYLKNRAQAVAAYYDITFGNGYHFSRNRESTRIESGAYLQDIAIIGMNCDKKGYGYLSAGPVAVLYCADIARNIDYPVGIKYMEDVIWNIAYFSQCKKVSIIDECVYAYRQNQGSATHNYSLSVIDDRKKSLELIKKAIGASNQWYPLRLFTNYTACCRCVVKTNEIPSFLEKLRYCNTLYKDPLWNDFKAWNVRMKWNKKFKIKFVLASIRILPFVYVIQH